MNFSSIIINYFFLLKIKIIIIKKIIFISTFSFLLYINLIKKIIVTQKNNEVSQSQSKFFKMKNNLDFFKLVDIKYIYSFKFNIIKVEYNIEFYENNKNLILPSDLTLYKNLHIFCHIESNNSNIIINSYPDVIENKIFKCIEYFNIYEDIKFGIQIFEINEDWEDINNHIYFFSREIFNYLNLFKKDDKVFDSLLVNSNYFVNLTKTNINDDNLKLKKTYTLMPKCILKKYLLINDDDWKFQNLFNEYFCFCKNLNAIKLKNSQNCKYYFYINLIDKNRNIYPKTDYLFIDFIFNDLSSDDAFPIFKEMIKEKLPVHYLTESSDIYSQYCSQINKCQTILLVNNQNYTINGDFLEKYLTLFLKLKQVISGSGIYFDYINNLFFDIEYITLISVTHGVCYFKYFLYEENRCYGTKRIDKVLIPPSEKILSFAINYGWNSRDIIKLNLPKWDKYNERNNSKYNLNNTSSHNSILIMFTWREVIKNRQISSHYFKNILNLILNKALNEELKKYNTIIYFALHYYIYSKYKYRFEDLEYIQCIKVNNIIEYIEKSNLFITDFSSIVFDFIYQKKPYIIYIPDCNDYLLNKKYKKNYYELIQSMKNDTIRFENKFFNIDSAINKILFYLSNNFKLDNKLKIFYDSLKLTQKNNIYEFIKYIKNLN